MPKKKAGDANLTPDAILQQIGDIAEPPGFDPEATIIAVNFPIDVSELSVGSFYSWCAPVVHVDRIDSSVTSDDANFRIVFVDRSSAKRVLEYKLEYPNDDHKTSRTIGMKSAKPAPSWYLSVFGSSNEDDAEEKSPTAKEVVRRASLAARDTAAEGLRRLSNVIAPDSDQHSSGDDHHSKKKEKKSHKSKREK